MKTFFFYLYAVLYFLWTLVYKLKLDYIKKHGTKEEVEESVFKITSGWARNILKAAGTRVIVKGKENLPEGNCLIVANHQGNFDFFIILGYIGKPVGFISKKENLKVPIARMWMREMHCIFMDRENIRESIKSINEGIENLKAGYTMVIFPEGTRSKGNRIGEFKQGSLKLGIKADVPIVPVTIDGTYKIMEANHGKIKAAEVTMTIGKPVYARDFSREEQKELGEILKNTIKSSL